MNEPLKLGTVDDVNLMFDVLAQKSIEAGKSELPLLVELAKLRALLRIADAAEDIARELPYGLP